MCAFDIIKACDPAAKAGVAHALTPFRSLRWPGLLGRADDRATRQADYFFNLHFLDSVASGRVDMGIDERRPAWEPMQDFLATGEPEWRPRLDFVGVNYYRPLTIRWHPLIALGAGLAGGLLTNLTFPVESDAGTKVEPGGLLEMIRRAHERYRLPILVTENGIAESSERIRSAHLVAHVASLRDAESEGISVLGSLCR